jgi:DNA-binding GntR family transcriptional regulator
MHDARQTACTILEERIVRGELEQGRRLDERSLAGELQTDQRVVREALACLERDNLTRAEEDGTFSVTPLNEVELRELYPVALLLEGLAVRSAPAFPAEQLAELRTINERMRAGADDAMAAATCDWRFHEELVRGCGNEQLLDTLRPLKRQLLRYEFAYMDDPASVETSVAQHAQIVAALERDDRDAAAVLVEDNWRNSLPGLLTRLGSDSARAIRATEPPGA